MAQLTGMNPAKILASAEAKITGEVYTTNVLVRERQYIADEPKVFGSNDEGSAPAEYF